MTARWIATLTLLEVGLLGMLLHERYGGILTASDLLHLPGPPPLRAGAVLPAFIGWTPAGAERVELGGRTSSVIFSGCTQCDRETVLRWAHAARLRGDRLVIVLQAKPEQLSGIRRTWPLTGKVLASDGYPALRRLGLGALPVLVRVLGNGVILGIEQPATRWSPLQSASGMPDTANGGLRPRPLRGAGSVRHSGVPANAPGQPWR